LYGDLSQNWNFALKVNDMLFTLNYHHKIMDQKFQHISTKAYKPQNILSDSPLCAKNLMTSDCLSGTSRGHSKPGAAATTATAGAGAGAEAAPAKIWDFTGRF
jgi:hypothetical protein